MATLLSLVDDERKLVRLSQRLPAGGMPIRRMYLRPEAIADIKDIIAPSRSDRGKDTTPLQELDDFLTLYTLGRPLNFPKSFHPLHHVDAGVWEFKTVDVRIFGWFSAIDAFVCTNIDLKVNVMRGGYAYYRDLCSDFRDQLALDEPKFVPGDDPAYVVSNYTSTS